MNPDRPEPKRNPAVIVLLVVVLATAAMILWPGRDAGDQQESSGVAHGGSFRVTCTFLPVYVFALNVVGDAPGVGVDLLVPPSVGCPHHYALRAKDLKLVAHADVIVANGLGLEGFLDEVIRSNSRGELVFISSNCDVLNRQWEGHDHHHGAETDDHEDHDHEGHDHEGHGHEEHEAEGGDADQIGAAENRNPHVWVSPIEAVRQVQSLAGHLSRLDPERADRYQANADAYVSRLQELFEEMKDAAEGFGNRRIVTYHDSFDYLARDLGLEVVATITDDPEGQMAAGRMKQVTERIRAAKPAAIFVEPAYPDQAARTIARETGLPVFMINPLNTMDTDVTRESYERVMRSNLQVLIQALGASN